MSTEIELYQTDIAFKEDFQISATGDLGKISGLANFKQAIIRRIMTTPGEIIHRPTYGVGLKNFVNGINSLSQQQRLAAKLREQLAKEPRVEAFEGLRVESSALVDGMVKIFVRVRPVGLSELTLAITTEAI